MMRWSLATVLSGSAFLVVAVVSGCSTKESSAAFQPASARQETPTHVTTQAVLAMTGQTAKPFSLPDDYGTTQTPGQHFGKRPVVLVFYRGSW